MPPRYEEITDDNIHKAVEEWCRDKKSAMYKYGPIEEWDTSNVTDMKDLFTSMSDFNDDISNWDVSKVTNMRGMFNDASSFDQKIGKWDMSNVTNVRGMFNEATSFNQPLGKWDTTKSDSCRLHVCRSYLLQSTNW